MSPAAPLAALLLALAQTAGATAPPAAAYVCLSGDPDPACTHFSLVDALEDNHVDITLSAGAHQGGVILDRPGLVLRGDPGAVLTEGPGLELLVIDAPNVRVEDLELDAEPNQAAEHIAVRVKLVATGTELRDVTVRNAFTWFGVGALWVEGDVLCTRCRFEDNESSQGAAVHADLGAVVEIVGGRFDRNVGSLGGAIHAQQATLTIRDSAFDDSEADLGGHIYLDGGSLTLQGSDLAFGEASVGGAVYATAASDLTVTNSVFRGNRANIDDYAAGIDLEGAGQVSVQGSWFEDHDGIAVRAQTATSLTVTDTVFDRNRVDGALRVNFTPTLVVEHSWFCDNEGFQGGAIRSRGACAGICSISDTVFVSNMSQDRGGAIRFQGPINGAIALERVTFVSNEGAYGGAAYFAEDLPSLSLLGVLAWNNRTTLSGSVIAAVAPVNPVAVPSVVYGWDNQDTTLDPSLGAAVDLIPSPGVHDTWQPCGGEPALLDCADPALGTLLTGPLAVDKDSDGYVAACECDDLDGTAHPGATEIPADGIDQDCDGLELCFVDSDLDGFGSTATTVGGFGCREPGTSDNDLDCDDDDPNRYPHSDTPCDGSPTTGTTGTTTAPGPDPDPTNGTGPDDPNRPGSSPGPVWLAGGAACGCSGGGAPASGLGLVLAVVGLRRRQRAAASPSRNRSSAEP